MRRQMDKQRGVAMAVAILAVAVLLFAAIVVLQFTSYSATNAGSVAQKQAAFDAAEAGLNDCIRALDASSGTSASSSGTLGTNASYTCSMPVNNFGKASSTYQGMTIPANSAYVVSTASIPGFRSETVGAIVGRASGLPMPGGALDAGANIYDGSHAPILQSTTNVQADVHANGNITVGGNPGTVQGSTYSAGPVNQWTTAYTSKSNQPPVQFPSTAQDTAVANSALGLAKTGTTISSSSPTGTYTGNVFVTGGINITNGTLQFNGGGTVYINGNVSISSKASLVNRDGSLIVVNGTFSSSGQGGLSAPSTSSAAGQLMVLASDPNSASCFAGTGGCAVMIAGSSTSIGLIFAPYGSVQIAGNGTITGAIAAGDNLVFSGGGSHGAFQYDPVAGTTPVKPALYQSYSYIEE